MNTRRSLSYLAVGLVALAVSVAAPKTSVSNGAQAAPQVRVFGGRTLAQRSDVLGLKFDATLADLSAHLGQIRAGQELMDLHAMNPGIQVAQIPGSAQPLVLVDAVTRGDPQGLKASLENLGMIHAVVYSNDVGGWLPTSALRSAAALSELHSIRAAMPRTRAGPATTQGDFAQGSLELRTANSALTGVGVTVGVLSVSFNCYAVYAQANSGVPASGTNGYAENGFTADYQSDVSTGALPSNVNVLEEAGIPSGGQPGCLNFGAPELLPFSDEGRAMLQIVHDVAPGAGLAFYTASNSEADFASGIVKLHSEGGATVEADDVGYIDEPFFQDGMIAQAIDAVEAQGVAYFSAAGNDAENAYESTSPSFATPAPSGPQAGEMLLGFTGTNQPTTTSLSVSLPPLVPGEFVPIVLEWDQPYVTGAPGSPGASSQLDLCISGETGTDQVISFTTGNPTTCTGLNKTGMDANQILLVGIPANAPGNSQATAINISVGLAAGGTAPGRIKLAVEDDGAGAMINSNYATNSPTVQDHAEAAGAVAVGAAFFFNTPACGTSPPVLETFSSEGGDPILFDTSGNRLVTPVVRQKPQVVGPDGGNNTFLGYTLANAGVTGGMLPTSNADCQNNPKYPNFFGTSAATPHVAGIAALMLQTNSALTPTQIATALENSAIQMGGSSPNFNDGFGFVQAGAALALLPPGPPKLSSSVSSVTVGGSATLTWSSLNTSSCTASGGWNGSLPTSGSQSVTPSTVGTATYTLTCSNAVGSADSSVNLDVVVPAPASHGGGGALDEMTLLALVAMYLMRQLRNRCVGV
jgi:Subtilase family